MSWDFGPGDGGSASGLPASGTGDADGFSQTGWGDADLAQDTAMAGSGGALAVQRPPVVWLWAAIGAALVAGALLAVGGATPVLAFGAWALAGPVAITLLALFTREDTKRRSAVLYSSSGLAKALYWGGIVLALLVVIAAGVYIALWVGRL